MALPSFKGGGMAAALVCCFCLFFGQLPAQHKLLDSLYIEAQKENPPKLKLEKQLVYLNYLSTRHLDSAIAITDSLYSEYQNAGLIYEAAHCKSLQSWFLFSKAQYEKGHRLAHEALVTLKKLNDSSGIALSLNRIGICNLQFGKLEEAEKYMNEALGYFIGLRDSSRIDAIYNNLGIVALERKDYANALKYYRKSLNLRIVRKSWHWVAYAYYNIGSLYLNIKELDSAEFYLNKSKHTFLNKTRHRSVVPMLYLSLAELEFEEKDYAKAVNYADTSLKIAEERERTEMMIEASRFLAEAQFYKGEFKKAYQTQQRFLDLKLKMDSVNNIASVSEVEERYKNAEKEKELIQLRAVELDARSQAQRLRMTILYISVLVLILTILVAYGYFKKRQKQKLSEAHLNAKIADMKLVALRSQMNPHFIFNSINTAQNFILHSKTDLAYDYLAKFAKLLRNVLENSDRTFISLEDEVNQLQLYIELEAIRFDQKFKFALTIDDALKDGVFEIPSMILQPFVENAILHGLVNKHEGIGKLNVSLRQEGESVLCIVEDNGVGRKQANQIKTEKKRFYKGKALPNIEERLRIIEQNTGLNIDLNITDLYKGAQASGTRVSLYLPLN